uniref:WAP domain-containing protein n=1 Tax=Anolis carolinensis TaxID=28377 RepID=A0A803TUL7_ANOCA
MALYIYLLLLMPFPSPTENPGLCPKRSLPLEFFPCREDCKDDRSCSRGKKCCFVGCGLRCIVPKIYHNFCQLPSASGTCDAPSVLRVFYNSTCERFFYRGHRGNANNFWEEEDCLVPKFPT